MGTIFNILIFAISAYLIFAIFFVMKRNKKNKQYIDCIDLLDNEEEFFKAINTFLETMKDDEFKTKGKIIKLYGKALYNNFDEFEEELDALELKPLFGKVNQIDKKTISLNEDSFYYYCFLTSFLLYKNNRLDLIDKMNVKLAGYQEGTKDQLFYEIYVASQDIYTNKYEHIQYFKDILNGEYTGLYAKQMIGLYKKTVACLLAKLELMQNSDADISYILEDLASYKKSELGNRILSSLGIAQFIKESGNIERSEDEETTSDRL